jgi:hypothetical protein
VIITCAGGERHVAGKLAAAADKGWTGKYWYHEASAAYFESKEQYRAAKSACLKPAEEEDDVEENDHVQDAQSSSIVPFVVFVVINFFGGMMLCVGFATDDIHWGHKLAMLLGSGFGCAALACILLVSVVWFRRDRGGQS